MELIERAEDLAILQRLFGNLAVTGGHCVLVCGEAGIGKTSLVRNFCAFHPGDALVLQGTCDALFTPRPLAPLYDILWQLRGTASGQDELQADRNALFHEVYRDLAAHRKPCLLLFEDIHWADEATLDFIKFLARRISGIRCLFLLTFRDNEIHARHPLRNVLGQLPPAQFTRLALAPLSRQAVTNLAQERGYNGEDVYSITSGNPFYVQEILASYSSGIPENIRDAVLSVYYRQEEATRQIWEILSVLPTGLELAYLDLLGPAYREIVENGLFTGILVLRDGIVHFKHELYRRAIEAALSPLLRIGLNRKILEILRDRFAAEGEVERIVHHARQAQAMDWVVQYAPGAAAKAAGLGAHLEAARLWLTAIESYTGKERSTLIRLYESYAYECYLTNRTREAIRYMEKSLALRQEEGDTEQTGNCLRFLSRLWWFIGNRKNAEDYGARAIGLLDNQPASRAKAMALSNMAQLKMLSDEDEACIRWGMQAIGMARELGDEEILCHALNNVGTAQMGMESGWEKGMEFLQQSLALALRHSWHEHVARAYTNLAYNAIDFREYVLAGEMLKSGIHYGEERDLTSWTTYMLSVSARLHLETGDWKEASRIALLLMQDEQQTPVVLVGALVVEGTIRMRQGTAGALALLLRAWEMALEAQELQRMMPVLIALLEYEWITGERHYTDPDLELTIGMLEQKDKVPADSVMAWWLYRVRQRDLVLPEGYPGYRMENPVSASRAAACWERAGCPYEQALALLEAGEEEKKQAMGILQDLGATLVFNKMKHLLRDAGLRHIPRGMRAGTRANPANLTSRELDVLNLLREGMQNKEIAARLFISAKTVDHHISSILFKLDVNTRMKAIQEAGKLGLFQ